VTHNTYTDEQRTEALQSYTEHGTTATSKRLNIPRRTILTWAKDAGLIARADQEKTAEAKAANAERVQAAWGDYRENEALGAGSAAVRLRTALLEAVEGDTITHEDGRLYLSISPQLIRALSISYGILIDKAELLSGRATQRIETWAESELDTEIRHLIREMEDRILEDADADTD